jgi:hypothetical protein
MTRTLSLILTLLPNVDTFPLQADRMSSKAVKFVAGLAWEQRRGGVLSNGKKRRLAVQTVASLSISKL